jgi:hypothetical protein
VPCGQGRHSVRWEAGELRLASHADPGAELVLAALGGDKARCVEIAEAWQRHTADLTVLGIGPGGSIALEGKSVSKLQEGQHVRVEGQLLPGDDRKGRRFVVESPVSEKGDDRRRCGGLAVCRW